MTGTTLPHRPAGCGASDRQGSPRLAMRAEANLSRGDQPLGDAGTGTGHSYEDQCRQRPGGGPSHLRSSLVPAGVAVDTVV